MIVVDTNIIAYFYLNSARTQQVEKLLQQDSLWAAPILWRSEFRNVLLLYLRKEKLSITDTQAIMEEAMFLMSGNEYQVISADVLQLAASSACSAYDCEFVSLAQELNAPLVTVDKQILREFPKTAISLDNFLSL